jgi:hypothetical protein
VIVADTPTRFTLRCHSCSHAVGTAPQLMKIAALFKASSVGRLRRAHAREIKRRCDSCGFVNVFHPANAGEVIVLK